MILISSFFSEIIHAIHYLATWFASIKYCIYDSYKLQNIFMLFISLSSLFTYLLKGGEMREKKQRKETKIILEVYQDSYNDPTIIVRNILTRWVQQHQRRLQTMNGEGHTSRPMVLGLTCLWATCVAYFNHRWWSFLILLVSSRWDIFNNTGGVIIEVSVYLRDFFFLSFFPFLLYSFLLLLNLVSSKFSNLK